MNMLIIGGTGFLSAAIAEVAINAGHELTVFTRGNRPYGTSYHSKFIKGDRTDRNTFRTLLGCKTYDVVIDAVCYTPEDALQDIDVFSSHIGRMIMISTDFVYKAGLREFPTDETCLRYPSSSYGYSKMLAEDILLNASNLPTTVLRPSHITGTGGVLGTGSLQGRDPRLINHLRRELPVILLDTGSLLIQPVDRRDVARACLAVINSASTSNQAYNIAGCQVISSYDYYKIVADLLAVDLNMLSLDGGVYTDAYPECACYAQHRVYSTVKLQKDAEFSPQILVQDSLYEMVDNLVAHLPLGLTASYTSEECHIISLLASGIQPTKENLLKFRSECQSVPLPFYSFMAPPNLNSFTPN